jgi:hypothetical protein
MDAGAGEEPDQPLEHTNVHLSVVPHRRRDGSNHALHVCQCTLSA